MIVRDSTLHGHRLPLGGCLVTVDGEPLACCPGDERTRYESYDWGHVRGDALILSRALLYAATGDRGASWALAPDFTLLVVRHLPEKSWRLNTTDVLRWIESDPARAVWLGRN